MTSEQKIQNDIVVALSANGCTVFRSNAGVVRMDNGRAVKLAPKGWPDITGFRNRDGKAVLIEVKNEKGRLRDDQKRFKKLVENMLVLYGVCRSVEDALKIVEG